MSEGEASGKFRKVNFDRGTVILEEGGQGECAYLILRGTVEIRKAVRSSTPRTLAHLGPGDVIGEMALYDDQPHMASAFATTDVEASTISRAEFKRRLAAMDPVMRGILGMLVERGRRMAEMLIERKEFDSWFKGRG